MQFNMEKYKEIVKQIIQSRYVYSCIIQDIKDIRFVSEGIKVDYTYLYLKSIKETTGELICNSELNAYMYENL